jgi:PRTRC genetic system ThiF family protein
MEIIHHLSLSSHPMHRPVRTILIGSGGNGSSVLFGLPYLHQAMLAWGGRGLSVTVIDADTVSPTNCVRQPFGVADIGQNKATVLVNRVNLFHSLQWTAMDEFFSEDTKVSNDYFSDSIDFVISCVDTRAARRAMHAAFTSNTGRWNQVRYWLDLGNSSSNGQFVLGQPRNAVNKASRERLRTVTELLPEIMSEDLGEDDLPSCSAAEALDRQEPFVNNVLATSSLSMLTRLLRHSQLSFHGAFFNAETGSTAPLAIDPDIWELQRRRSWPKAKSAVIRKAG